MKSFQNHDDQDIWNILICSGVQIVGFWAVVMALCAIGLFFGFPLQAAYVIVSFCVVVALSAFLSEWAGKVVMISAAVSLCAIALSCFLAGQFIDWSCDGNMYHKIAVAALSEGWNPFRGSVADAEAYSFVYPEGSSAVLWVDQIGRAHV